MGSRKYQGTWNGKQLRWFKKYDRRQYAVSVKELQKSFPHLVKSPTKEGSYLAFNSWWQAKLRKLTSHPQEAEINAGIETRRQLAAWSALEQREDLRQLIQAEAEVLRLALRNNTPLTLQEPRRTPFALVNAGVLGKRWYLDALPVNPFCSNETVYHGEELDVWQDRLRVLQQHEAWATKQKGMTFSQAVILFLDNHQKSPARVANLRLYLGKFKAWKGDGNLQVTALDLINYKAHLLGLVKEGKKSLETARSEMIGLKQFINWAWEAELVEDLPRNLRSKSLAIANGEAKKVTWTDEQIRTAITASADRMRLFILLQLNCGMYSADIAALEHDQVDWKHGTVQWTRAKTGKGNGLKYQLWPETFALLRKLRGNHPTLVLTTRTGQPLKISKLNENHHERKTDMIGLAFRRWNESKKLNLPPLKELRKTARNKLENHAEFARYAQAFLQQAARSVDEKWYRKPSQEAFDRALAWLRTQFIQQ